MKRTTKLVKPIDHVHRIRHMFKLGQISYDEAKLLALPFIKEMEVAAEKVAKEFGRTPPKFSFTSLMR